VGTVIAVDHRSSSLLASALRWTLGITTSLATRTGSTSSPADVSFVRRVVGQVASTANMYAIEMDPTTHHTIGNEGYATITRARARSRMLRPNALADVVDATRTMLSRRRGPAPSYGHSTTVLPRATAAEALSRGNEHVLPGEIPRSHSCKSTRARIAKSTRAVVGRRAGSRRRMRRRSSTPR
jgi:hypothetical protein